MDTKCALPSIPSRHVGLMGYVHNGSGKVVFWETQGSPKLLAGEGGL